MSSDSVELQTEKSIRKKILWTICCPCELSTYLLEKCMKKGFASNKHIFGSLTKLWFLILAIFVALSWNSFFYSAWSHVATRVLTKDYLEEHWCSLEFLFDILLYAFFVIFIFIWNRLGLPELRDFVIICGAETLALAVRDICTDIQYRWFMNKDNMAMGWVSVLFLFAILLILQCVFSYIRTLGCFERVNKVIKDVEYDAVYLAIGFCLATMIFWHMTNIQHPLTEKAVPLKFQKHVLLPGKCIDAADCEAEMQRQKLHLKALYELKTQEIYFYKIVLGFVIGAILSFVIVGVEEKFSTREELEVGAHVGTIHGDGTIAKIDPEAVVVSMDVHQESDSEDTILHMFKHHEVWASRKNLHFICEHLVYDLEGISCVVMGLMIAPLFVFQELWKQCLAAIAVTFVVTVIIAFLTKKYKEKTKRYSKVDQNTIAILEKSFHQSNTRLSLFRMGLALASVTVWEEVFDHQVGTWTEKQVHKTLARFGVALIATIFCGYLGFTFEKLLEEQLSLNMEKRVTTGAQLSITNKPISDDSELSRSRDYSFAIVAPSIQSQLQIIVDDEISHSISPMSSSKSLSAHEGAMKTINELRALANIESSSELQST